MALTVDFFLMIVAYLIECSSVVIFNLYSIAHYAHPEDTAFARSKLVKAFIILSYSTNFFLIMTVPLDVFLTTYKINADGTPSAYNKNINVFIGVWWNVLSFTTISMVFIALPLMIAFYESNPNQSVFLRVKTALKINLINILLMLLITVPSFFLLN